MWLWLPLILLLPASSISSFDWEYTHEAYTIDNKPCLTNCIAGKCVVNLEKKEEPCEKTGSEALFYFTSQKRAIELYCLSKCGLFERDFEWCVTHETGFWDYCSSYQATKDLAAKASNKKACLGSGYCTKGKEAYYTCKTGRDSWDICSPAAIPRPTFYQTTTPPPRHPGTRNEQRQPRKRRYPTNQPRMWIQRMHSKATIKKN